MTLSEEKLGNYSIPPNWMMTCQRARTLSLSPKSQVAIECIVLQEYRDVYQCVAGWMTIGGWLSRALTVHIWRGILAWRLVWSQVDRHTGRRQYSTSVERYTVANTSVKTTASEHSHYSLLATVTMTTHRRLVRRLFAIKTLDSQHRVRLR